MSSRSGNASPSARERGRTSASGDAILRWLVPLGRVSSRSWRVWQRDFDVYRTTWLVNFLPPLLEPVLYVLSFGIGMGSLIGVVVYEDRELPYLRFMVPGVISVAVMFWAYFETTYSSFVRMYYQRTFDAILATPLLIEDVIAGEWLWGATKSVIASTVMLAIMGIFGLVEFPLALTVPLLGALGGLLFAALGLITTAVCPKIDTFNVPNFLFIFPMFLFSGTFFPLDVLPDWARIVAWALPLTHVSYLVRGACLGTLSPEGWPSLAYLALVTPVAFATAMTLMRRRMVR